MNQITCDLNSRVGARKAKVMRNSISINYQNEIKTDFWSAFHHPDWWQPENLFMTFKQIRRISPDAQKFVSNPENLKHERRLKGVC